MADVTDDNVLHISFKKDIRFNTINLRGKILIKRKHLIKFLFHFNAFLGNSFREINIFAKCFFYRDAKKILFFVKSPRQLLLRRMMVVAALAISSINVI